MKCSGVSAVYPHEHVGSSKRWRLNKSQFKSLIASRSLQCLTCSFPVPK